MQPTALLALLCVASSCVQAALVVRSPASLARTGVRVVTRSKFLPPQTREVWFDGTAWAAEGSDELSPTDSQCAAIHGKVVLLKSLDSNRLSMAEEFRSVAAAELCGAVGVVFLLRDGFMGSDFFVRDADCCRSQGHTLHVPVLGAARTELGKAFDAAVQGQNVTLSVEHADRNGWEETFEHIGFYLFGRVLLSAANAVVGLIAVRAFCKHWLALRHVRKGKTPTVFDSTRKLILLALVLQVFGCVLRTYYCAVGPFLSTSTLTWLTHHMLLNLSMPIQLPVICIVSYIFRRLVLLKRNVRPPSPRPVAAVGAVCAGVFVLELLGGYIRGRREDYYAVVFVSGAFSFVIVVASLVLVLVGGVPFLWSLNSTKRFRDKGGLSNPVAVRHSKQIRAKFARTVVYGSSGVALQVVALVLVVIFTNYVGDPVGFSVSFILYYWAITITALFHTLAFAPIVRVRVIAANIKRSVATSIRHHGSKEVLEDSPIPSHTHAAFANAQWNSSGQFGLEEPVELAKRPTCPGSELGAALGEDGNEIGESPAARDRHNPGAVASSDSGGDWREADLMDDALVLHIDPDAVNLGFRESVRLKAAQYLAPLTSRRGEAGVEMGGEAGDKKPQRKASTTSKQGRVSRMGSAASSSIVVERKSVEGGHQSMEAGQGNARAEEDEEQPAEARKGHDGRKSVKWLQPEEHAPEAHKGSMISSKSLSLEDAKWDPERAREVLEKAKELGTSHEVFDSDPDAEESDK